MAEGEIEVKFFRRKSVKKGGREKSLFGGS